MATQDLASISGYSATSDAPPPPPKPPSNYQRPSSSRPHSVTGPPPPPPRTDSYSRPPQTREADHHQRPHSQSIPSSTPAPFLPSTLIPKTTQQLTPILSTPSLLQSLSHQHPSLSPSSSPLSPLLAQTSSLAQHLESRHTHLLALRQQTQNHLLALHALERQWKAKQAQLDRELEPWSAKSLYQSLREAEREGEDVSRGVEGSWLEDGGEMGEREVETWLKGWREGRVKCWKRREWRERWDEGRVGGWR